MLRTDWQHAVRRLRSRPALAAAAVAMLGLGIGLTTAMFAVTDALILRPVPFARADDLAQLYTSNGRGGSMVVAPAVLRAWRESPAFSAAESARADTVVLEADGAVATRRMAWVTPGVFNMLGGVRPLLGRLFDRDEGRAGSDDRVLLSEDVWRALYHADPAIVGRRVTLDGAAATVIGVLPSQFHFPAWDVALWRPIDFDAPPPAYAKDRPFPVVRFAPDVPRADALRMATDTLHALDGTTAGMQVKTGPLSGLDRDTYDQRALPLLSAGVVLMFLVLCGNVSSLLLAHLTARRRDFGICAALGASRGRLLRESFVESSLLGGLGVIAGIGLGWTLMSLARAFLPDAYLLRTLHPFALDPRALAIAAASGTVATLTAGLLPAWLSSRVDVTQALRAVEHGSTDTPGARAATRGLLVIEIALACTLLVGATLLVRSFVNLARADRGFDTQGVLTATMTLPAASFPNAASRVAATQALEEKVRELPGVQQVVWSFGVPPANGNIDFGQWTSDLPGVPAVDLVADSYNVGPEFFALYGIPLLRGRTFAPSDSDREAIVGERLARTLWPGLDPIDRTFHHGDTAFHVIGLAKEINYPSVDAGRDRPELYLRFRGIGRDPMMSLRCGGTCPDVATLRQHLALAHPAVRINEVRRLDDVYVAQFAQPRAAAALAFAFAGIAVFAAGGGLFCVLSYAVGRRRRELGIRLALGASPAQVRWLVLRDDLIACLAGIAIGTAGAWSLARAIASLQYGVTVSDPVSWSIVCGVIALVAITASWRPAREAMHVDPARLLRDE
jgi:putative ABC transport system permease protein